MAGFPFEYSFLDETYDKLYKSEQRTGVLFALFSAVVVLISCLGLFGLATYTAQVKTREIGIRKVLGASVVGGVALLSRDFIITGINRHCHCLVNGKLPVDKDCVDEPGKIAKIGVVLPLVMETSCVNHTL